MERRSLIRLTMPVAVAMLVTLAACGRDDAAKSAGAPAARPSAEGNQVNPMPRDRVQDGGRLVWPISGMPVNFNYHELDGPDADGAYILLAILPSVYSSDASGTPVWNSDYLASEPALSTEPKQVVTYRISTKATWDDGTPITWQDFHWQWQAVSGRDKAYRLASSNGYADIESVQRGQDDREVIVTFREHYADWKALFSPLYPESTNKNPALFNDGWRAKPLAGAGPFKFQSLDRTAQTLTLVRNDKWWGNRAKLDSIVFRSIEIDAQVDALANGEIDVMDIGPNVNTFNRAKAIAGVDLRIAGGPNFRHLTINGSSPNLQDVRVRKALAMGIDRQAIARALLGPLGIPTDVLNNHIFMANQAGYRDNAGDVGRYDPARAAQLLDEAGWTLQGTTRRKGGRSLDVRMVIPSGVATSRQESELVQNMLGRLGVSVRIDTVPTAEFFDRNIRPGQFDFTVFSWIGTPFPISSSQSIYMQPKINASGQMDVQQNYARIGSPEIDDLFRQANAELDRGRAIDIANQLDALIWQEVHSLTLYQRPELWACKRGLANIGAKGFADFVYEDMGWAKP